MNMQTVESSNIDSIGYENNTLRIKFKHGGAEYDYFDVPEDVHQDLMASESVGSYFAKNVRNEYKWEKL